MQEAIFIFFLVGISVGSFLNVCAYRIPRGMSVASPGSFCPMCKHTLGWLELVPIASFFVQRGKCKHCSAPISWRYPVVEAISGSLVVFTFLKYGMTEQFILIAVFLLFMLLICIIDWEHLRIPNIMIIVGLTLGIILKSVIEPTQILDAIGGSVLAAGSIALIRFTGNTIFKKETMGLGDVKLAAVIGLFLGIGYFLLAVWIAAVLGVMYGVVKKILRANDPDSNKIPFGSFLAAAAGVIIVFTQTISNLWLSFVSL
jgi:prepilin signal peptidase PulO-like enzyme (type II secretory pathway)